MNSKLSVYKNQKNPFLHFVTSRTKVTALKPLFCVKPDCKIGICFFSAKHTVLRRKSKDWLALNQDTMS